MERFKLIVADLDGTLLHDDKTLDTKIKQVLQEKQIPMTFVSGRNVHIIQEYLEELNITLPYVTNNGANIFLGKKCIYECSIDPKELEYCLTTLQEKEVAYLAYTNEQIYCFGNQPGLEKFKKRLIGKCEIIEQFNLLDLLQKSIFKVVMIHKDMEKIQEVLNAHCKQTVCMRSEGNIFTLTNANSTKGKTLLKLLEYLKIQPDEVLAFGDNYNDIPMFEVVDGVAVENAQEGLKQVAKYQTKSNEEDGVSYFIEHNL